MRDPNALLVTGGSRGIGAEIVSLAVRQGYKVCFTYNKNRDSADRLCQRLNSPSRRVVATCADVSNISQIDQVISDAEAEIGPITALVNNAGITSHIGRFQDRNIETVRRVFDVNVFGPMAYCQAFMRLWEQRRSCGRIVNISSIAAVTGSPGEYIHYASSKAALEAFTVGLAREVATSGTRVNAVAPGTVDTEIHAEAGERDRAERVAKSVPMRRPGQAREVASAVLWLLTEEASYITGTVLRVSGGL